MSNTQPASSVAFGGVSGGKVIGAGGGAGSIIGETVEVNGPVIHIHNLTEEGARLLRGIAGVSPEVQAAPVPDAPSGEGAALLRGGIDEMLRLMKGAAQRGIKALQVDAGGEQFSAVDLLLRKAVLMVSEANALTVASSAPEKAEAARRMDQGALSEMLAGFDGEEARGRLQGALEVLREARAVAPDSTAVMLQTAQVLGRMDAAGSPEERELLEEVLRRVATPWTEEQRLHRAQALYLLATLGRDRDPDLLREAREQFARLGRVDWMRQCDQALAAADAPGTQRRHVGVPRPQSAWKWPRRLATVAAAGTGAVFGVFVLVVIAAMVNADPAPAPAYVSPPEATSASTPASTSASTAGPAPTPYVQQGGSLLGGWQLTYADGSGGALNVDLLDGGVVQGSVRTVDAGLVTVSGFWNGDPAKGLSLSLGITSGDVVVIGLNPMETLPGAFQGLGTDGIAYRLTRR